MTLSGRGRRRSGPRTPQPSFALLLELVSVLGAAPADAAWGTAPPGLGPDTSSAVADSSPVKKIWGLLSPRMDYEKWTPLGRGDPLKNDPTYDYMPPVLDRVHYWIDPASRTPEPSGIITDSTEQSSSSRGYISIETTSTSHVNVHYGSVEKIENAEAITSKHDSLDLFLKFVDAPKFNLAHEKHLNNHQQSYHLNMEREIPYQQRKPHFPMYNFNPRSHSQLQQINSNIQASFVESQAQITTEMTFSANLHFDYDDDASNSSWETELERPLYTVIIPPPLQIPYSFSMSKYDNLQDISTSPPLQKTSMLPRVQTIPNVTLAEDLTFESKISEWESDGPESSSGVQNRSYVAWIIPSFATASQISNENSQFDNENLVPFQTTHDKQNDESNVGLLKNLLQNKKIEYQQVLRSGLLTTSMASSPEITTKSSTLTTDPLFSHYKQPVEPLSGPMYLIIQGHSKVKTYGARKHINSFH